MREEPSRGHRRAMRDVELDGDLVRPRRRRRSRRGFVAGFLALLMPRRTTDALALAFAVAATVAVLVNALAFQTRSPVFKSAVETPPTAARPAPTIKRTTSPATVAPAAIPAAAPAAPALAPTPPRRPETTALRPRAEIVQDIQRELTERGYYDGAVDGLLGPRTGLAMKEFTEAQGVKPAAEPNETLLAQIRVAPARSEITASIPPVNPASAATRVLAVQRTLAKFGYGPLRLNALHDRDTRTAIERFERDRDLPPSGEVSERLVRELAAFTGTPLE